MSFVMFNMSFAAFATAAKESCSFTPAASFWVGVSLGTAYCEELEEPTKLDKGKWGSRKRELEFGGVKCEFGEEGEQVIDQKPLELDGVDATRWCSFLFSVESTLPMPFLCSVIPALWLVRLTRWTNSIGSLFLSSEPIIAPECELSKEKDAG